LSGGGGPGIAIGRRERAAMEAHARRTYPEECCGILLGSDSAGRKTVRATIAIENAEEDAARRKRYTISPRDMLEADREARRTGTDVIGFYHSHPDVPAVPSATDLREATWPALSYVIVCVRGGAVDGMRSWTLAEDRSAMNEEPILDADD
jgi:proteasome lid subunit RPN8/RPN11